MDKCEYEVSMLYQAAQGDAEGQRQVGRSKPQMSPCPRAHSLSLCFDQEEQFAPTPHHCALQACQCWPVLKRRREGLRYSCRGHTGWAGGTGAARGH